MRTITDLGHALYQAREQTDELFRLVRADSLYQRPIPERHRIVFYLGHLEAFDWNLIARHALDVPSFHPTFDRLFAFGIDPPPGELPNDQPSDWPALAEVERYNHRTRDAIDDLMASVPDQLLHVAIEHRLMHAETLTYILHQLDYERKVAQPARRATGWPIIPRMMEISPGSAKLGLDGGFGWDNEFKAHRIDVPAFTIGQYKVTNADYLEFVAAGAEPPFFWTRRDAAWWYRGMFSEFPLPPDWPVYVTHRQAEAYANWRGLRLPTEAEWHRAAEGARPSRNVDFRYWDPIPVTADDEASAGISQIAGNGWEWTSTPFAPFPGFEPFPFYANYSEPFFDGRHFVLKGASPRTAACFLRPSFRNWFRPSYPYLYATFRLAGGRRSFVMYAQALDDEFAREVRAGLTRADQKTLPCRYLYDDIGSALFEAITFLPEYGLTRADARVIQACAGELMDSLPPGLVVAELGSGTGTKTRAILDELGRRQPVEYYPIDVSAAALARCAQELAGLGDIFPLETSYLEGLRYVTERRAPGQTLLVLFLGSTIGNFEPEAAIDFLYTVRQTLSPGDALLLGTDLVKPAAQLIEAYDDPTGVNRAFNLNLLGRINRELDADFDLRQFEHEIRYHQQRQRIEMHLRSLVHQTVRIGEAKVVVEFAPGETIWTEGCHKFRPDQICAMARATGFRLGRQWIDEEWGFAENLLVG